MTAPENAAWIAFTVLVYAVALKLYRTSNNTPLLHPVLTGSGVIIVILALTGVNYTRYADGVALLHKLLELATVAIAIPLYRERAKLKALARPLILSICAATLVNLASVAVLALTLKIHTISFASLMTKSVTTPVAIGISDLIGGNASLTAVIVINTGIVGAMFGPSVLRWMGITDPITTGIALGTVSHGVGTARAFQISTQAGAFAGLSMALCAIFTSLLLPTTFQIMFM